jgi:serine/threonine protein kinase
MPNTTNAYTPLPIAPRVNTVPITTKTIKKLGEGSYGIVKMVHGVHPGELLAYKKVCGGWDGLSSSFIREVSLLTLVSTHPNMVGYKGFTARGFFLELATADLKSYLTYTVLTPTLQLSFTKDLCNGLSYLHSHGIMHRDIKPQNILVCEENNNVTLKYTDFGISRGSGIALIGNFTPEIITLWYRPPELLLGAKEYDQRVDVWSLGCVLYEMVTKTPLFKGDCEIEQLFSIYKVFGAPNENTWPKISDEKLYPNYNPDAPFKNTVGSVCLPIIVDARITSIIKRATVMCICEASETTQVETRAYMPELMKIINRVAKVAPKPLPKPPCWSKATVHPTKVMVSMKGFWCENVVGEIRPTRFTIMERITKDKIMCMTHLGPKVFTKRRGTNNWGLYGRSMEAAGYLLFNGL